VTSRTLRHAAATGCLALAALAACRTLPFPEPKLSGHYGEILQTWTRKATLYDGLESRAYVRVVYLSPEMVAAQADHVSKLRAELPDEARASLEKRRAEYATPTFFAVVYTPVEHWNDWDDAKSVWRIALNRGLGEQRPTSVERLERPFSAELQSLYPYLDEYSVGYVLRFAAAPEGTQPPADFNQADVQLVAAGALGKMEFSWKPGGVE
jgi:hypothetical protein